MRFSNSRERDNVIRAIVSEFPGISPSLVDEIIKDMGYKSGKYGKKLRGGYNYPSGILVRHECKDVTHLYCDNPSGQVF